MNSHHFSPSFFFCPPFHSFIPFYIATAYECSFCNTGRFFERIDESCPPCSGGQFQEQNDQPSVECKSCEAGKEFKGKTIVCDDCISGKYQSQNVNSNPSSPQTCQAYSTCNQGRYAMNVADSSTNRGCADCAVGMFQTTSSFEGMACEYCDKGKYLANGPNYGCDNCASGLYQSKFHYIFFFK